MPPVPRHLPVFVAGATGAVGRALAVRLASDGWTVRCGSRDPERARASMPGFAWVQLDVDQPETLAPALRGCGAAYYLVHGMADGAGYLEREVRAAKAFAASAAEAGLERIVYLGGLVPDGVPSEHLWSRLETGRLLREGSVPCIELRAGMVIGPGSVSWRIVRDIAVRLPVQVLPAWLESRSQPVGIDDVCAALAGALELPTEGRSLALDVPGPETLTAREILMRVGILLEQPPIQIRVPLMSPGLSARWLRLVTRADPTVAAELVHGLAHDLVSTGPTVWERMPEHRQLGFDAVVERALLGEAATVSERSRRVEAAIHRFARMVRV